MTTEEKAQFLISAKVGDEAPFDLSALGELNSRIEIMDDPSNPDRRRVRIRPERALPDPNVPTANIGPRYVVIFEKQTGQWICKGDHPQYPRGTEAK